MDDIALEHFRKNGDQPTTATTPGTLVVIVKDTSSVCGEIGKLINVDSNFLARIQLSGVTPDDGPFTTTKNCKDLRIIGHLSATNGDVHPHEDAPKHWTREQHFEHVKSVFKNVLEITQAKNADYAGSVDPYANFRSSEDFGVPALTGLAVRMGDKLARVASYCRKGKLEVKNEGVEDAFLDLIGYSLLALGMLKEAEEHGNSGAE